MARNRLATVPDRYATAARLSYIVRNTLTWGADTESNRQPGGSTMSLPRDRARLPSTQRPSAAFVIWLPVVLLLPLAGGCQMERFFPEDVAAGVARLSFRNAAIVTSLISDDARCGFASEAVLGSAKLSGEIGSIGTLTWTVRDCELDLGELHVVKTDCSDVETSVAGSLTVSGTREVRGVLTGNPSSPIIPEGPDAVTIQLTYAPSEYLVRMSNRITALTQSGGSVAFTAAAHLAKSASTGVCSIPTSDLTITDLVYEDVAVIVDAGESDPFPAEVPRSKLSAQLGVYGDQENHLEGELTVWDTTVRVPLEDDPTPVLDPDYVFEAFRDSYACTEDLVTPLTYECPLSQSLHPKLAQGAAQLTISTFGNVAKLAEEECFKLPSVLASPTLTGAVGEAGGSARYDVENCVIELPAATEFSSDCLGKRYFAEGKVTVSGSKVVSGVLTGSAQDPVAPITTQPAVVSLEIELQGFAISDNQSDQRLFLKQGWLSGSMRPKTAIDTTLGVCALPTPVASFENIVLEDAVADLHADGSTYTIRVQTSSLEAQNGKGSSRENYLAGSMTVQGTAFGIPVAGEPVLNPAYTPNDFHNAYSCLPNLEIPGSDADCSLAPMLGENAARLIVLTAGTLASMVNADDECGFENTMLLIDPDEVIGESGETGSMSWSVEQCDLSGVLRRYSDDCSGGYTMISGGVVVDASRKVTGEREKKLVVVDSIIPRTRDAVDVRITSAALNDFVAYQVAGGDDGPKGKLTLHSGTIEARVLPRLGERESDPGVFDVPTPLAELASISLPSAEATLEAEGKTFKLTLSEVQLYARNGIFGGFGNQVSGSLKVNGELVEFGPIPLNPDFEQGAFDDAYACTEDLLEVIPTNE